MFFISNVENFFSKKSCFFSTFFVNVFSNLIDDNRSTHVISLFPFSFFNSTWTLTNRNFDKIRNKCVQKKIFSNSFNSRLNDTSISWTFIYKWRFTGFCHLNNENFVLQKTIFVLKWLFLFIRIMKHMIITFQSTFTSIKLTEKSDPQWILLRWNIKLRRKNAWYYLFFIQNIFTVGVIMPSISN